jgi:hypothetical protein
MIAAPYKNGEKVRILVDRVGLPLTGKIGTILGDPLRAKFDPDYYVYFVVIKGYNYPFKFFDDEIKKL